MSEEKELELLESRNGGRFGRAMRGEFLFDEGFVNLNHGSFGTYPRTIRSVLRSLQDAAEARPDDFIRYQYPKLLDEAREAMAKYLNVPTPTVVFVQNATTGVNTVLRALPFGPNDYILFSATIYGACEKAIAYITETTHAQAAKIEYSLPVEDAWLVSAFERKIEEIEGGGGRVKVAVFDTVVSMPGVRLPFEELTRVCRERGVLSLVDGAHGVGQVALDLGALDADFFVSNCHKWLHTPRGCAIFHVPLRNQHLIRSTLPTSHGFIPSPKSPFGPARNPLPPSDRPKSAFEANFDFVGSVDGSPYLCVPAALKWREAIGGEEVIRAYGCALAKHGARRMAEVLGTRVMDNSTGTLTQCFMANVALPVDVGKVFGMAKAAGVQEEDVGTRVRDWVSRLWIDDYGTFMQCVFYDGVWWVRVSAQVYLEMADFEWAAGVVKEVCRRVEKGEWIANTKTRL